MVSDYPALSDIWPFDEVTIPPQLAALPIEAFFAGPAPESVSAASWQKVTDPEVAPRSGYALRVMRHDGQATLARWDSDQQTWRITGRFSAPSQADDCVVIELRGIVLGNVANPEALEARIKVLLARELGSLTAFRMMAMVLSLTSVMTLYFAIRAGVEHHSPEPFALIFAIAVAAGLSAGLLKTRAKVVVEGGLSRIRDQFRFEYRASADQPLRLSHVNIVLRDLEGRREEAAAAMGFLLLLCFVYFVSPLMVVAVVVALVLVTLVTGSPKAHAGLAVAYDRAEQRLENALLSFRAGNDAMSTPALRRAKKQVLRDRVRRHNEVRNFVRKRQGRLQLNQDLAFALTFVLIFGTYALSIIIGIEKLKAGLGSSLVSTTLFSVAPVIVLISITRSTTIMAKVVNRQLALLSPR